MAQSPLRRRMKEFAKRRLSGFFQAGQRLGIDVLPRHFYSSIPDLRELRRTSHWRRPLSMNGVRGVDLDDQLDFIGECCAPSLVERIRRGDLYDSAVRENGELGYGPVEADFLHCFISTKRPRRVVQVGAGVSTAVILRAAAEAGLDLEVICIDPYPTEYLRRVGREQRVRLIAEPAQEVPLETLTEVGESGLLFVDSTHTVRPGSEVNRIILEALPRLPAGSYVHFHDISFPYDYHRDLLSGQLFFWGESVLLHAFLIHNTRIRLRAALSMLHYDRTDGLRRFLPNYQPQVNDQGLCSSRSPAGHFPTAAYLQVDAPSAAAPIP